ncbi:MAG: anti-sigma factor domain-containing protein [Acidimicrobiales bacterium]
MVADEQARLVRAAFARLSPERQELLELRVQGGLTSAQTGEVLGKGAGVVRMAQARALDRLRRCMEEVTGGGEFYEVWFVGPGDSRNGLNRISAGTFHPDEQGRTSVRFAAAVDPAKYPVLSITAEPGDGDPEPTGPEVLRETISPR